jgi:prepilin peptidase CpaA
MVSGMSTILAVLLGTILLLAGVEDARRREIANWKTGAIALLAPLWWWANALSFTDVGVQLALALVVFGLFCLAFHFGWMGGGDVKLIGALALWFPLGAFASLVMTMSLLGGGLTLILMVERAIRQNDDAVLEIPYGVAIAIAGLTALSEPIFNQINA